MTRIDTVTSSVCPACEVVYNKVDAALSRQRTATPFISTLRAEGNYPVFRHVVTLAFWIGQLTAVAALIIAILLFVADHRTLILGFSLGAAIIIHIMTRVLKEMFLMLADLSDATVRMAERQELQGRSSH